ncbi:MAG TPA: bestrophin family ion channel [Labilithrix sp.]|nr:bestrophin family ion channel [Labilithrix sp.]
MLSAKSVPVTYAFNKVKADVVRVMFFSLVFHGVKMVIKESLPEIPAVLPTVLGTSITLLLAFNVNQSYDRWWEARKVWGSLVNDSRSLIMQIASFAVDRADHRAAPVRERVAFRQIVFYYSLRQTLRGRPPLTEEQDPHSPRNKSCCSPRRIARLSWRRVIDRSASSCATRWS